MKKKKGFLSYVYYLSLIYFISSYGMSFWKSDKTNYENNTLYSSLVTESEDVTDIISKLEEELNINVSENNKDEALMLNAIYENKNLNNDEKNLFYGFYSVVEDIKNMDRNSAYSSLENVSINYKERPNNISLNTLGDYNYLNNQINIYKNKDSDYEMLNEDVILHEGIHCLFNNQKTSGLPCAFSEGMTELITNEFFSEDPFYEGITYPYEVNYVKMLCELVGKDLVLDCFVKGDIYPIQSEMDKYNDSEYSSQKIMDIYEDSYGDKNRYNTNERWKAFEILKDIYKKSHPRMENEKEFNYFYDLSASSFEENPGEFYAQYVFYYGVLEKAYFSSDLIQQFPSPKFIKFHERPTNVVKTKKIGNLTR